MLWLILLSIIVFVNADDSTNRTAKDLIPNRNTCGIQKSGPLTDGPNASLYEFPWVASIEHVSASTTRHVCGGTLVSKIYVLTGAICVNKKKNRWSESDSINVRLGEWDTRQENDCVSSSKGNSCNDAPQNIGVEEIKLFDDDAPTKRNMYYDIALLKLSADVEFTDSVRPICLPLLSEQIRDGSELIVSGWGWQPNENSVSPIKLKIPVTVSEQSECGTQYKKVNIEISSSQFCATKKLKDRPICAGLSGSPVMTTSETDPSQWVIYGLVSFGGNKCQADDFPDVFTKISSYLDWIYKNIN